MSEFLSYLMKNKENRGMMADLRCALVASKKHRAYPYLGYFNGIGDDFEALSKQTLAGLFALHPKTAESGNLGTVCHKLLSQEERKDYFNNPGPISKRLQYVLASEGDEIFERIVRIILFAKSKDIAIPYLNLEQDLKKWKYQSDQIKTEWANAFWAPGGEVEQ